MRKEDVNLLAKIDVKWWCKYGGFGVRPTKKNKKELLKLLKVRYNHLSM